MSTNSTKTEGSYNVLDIIERPHRVEHNEAPSGRRFTSGAVCLVPAIARQLRAIDPALLREELGGYGAWDETELADHAQNLQRLVWLAAGDINDY